VSLTLSETDFKDEAIPDTFEVDEWTSLAPHDDTAEPRIKRHAKPMDTANETFREAGWVTTMKLKVQNQFALIAVRVLGPSFCSNARIWYVGQAAQDDCDGTAVTAASDSGLKMTPLAASIAMI